MIGLSKLLKGVREMKKIFCFLMFYFFGISSIISLSYGLYHIIKALLFFEDFYYVSINVFIPSLIGFLFIRLAYYFEYLYYKKGKLNNEKI